MDGLMDGLMDVWIDGWIDGWMDGLMDRLINVWVCLWQLIVKFSVCNDSFQGGLESESSYPYCSGMGTCFPCVPRGWNNTRCGPPPTYCDDTFSCSNKLNKNEFVPGLKVKRWIAVEKVGIHSAYAIDPTILSIFKLHPSIHSLCNTNNISPFIHLIHSL